MSEFLFNKVAGLTQVFSCIYSEIFKNTYCEEHLRTAASDELVAIKELGKINAELLKQNVKFSP